MPTPLLNITIPVFNRFHLTQKTILHLQRLNKNIHFIITVVDNGSEAALQNRLMEFANDKIIDRLFLLPKNMGVACACNIGWDSIDTPYFMKLDNDIIVTNPDFITDIFQLWAHGQPMSTIGPALRKEWIDTSPQVMDTGHGKLALCTSNLPGGALLIPRTIHDILGGFNEDYGLYGAEDGDYGTRMNCAGFPQYYYDPQPYFTHAGAYDSSEYKAFGLDKDREHKAQFSSKDGSIGLFALNQWLYELCIRSWKIPRRFAVRPVSGYRYDVVERKEYQAIRTALRKSQAVFNHYRVKVRGKISMDALLNNNVTIASLKRIWENCDQECTISQMTAP